MSEADKTLKLEKSFKVVVRLSAHGNTHSVNRPEHSVSLDEPRASIKVTHHNRVVVDTGRSHKPHTIDFDEVLNEEASQRDVYESTTKSLVEYLMQGYNGCVIVYGSAGSGKTHTMQGCRAPAKHRGIISRAAEDIFTSPRASHCKIKVSFYHVFNEKIYDLLDPKGSEVIWVRDCEEVVRLDGLTEVEVISAYDLLQVHRRGSGFRHTGISKGDFPSRSHTVFSILVINTMLQSPEGVLTGSKLTLVDLASAGQSRASVVPDVKRTFSATNENLQETKMIKRSLAIFGNVIFALSSAGSQHVPYRESKLTRALRDCLGGNCRTCLVVTVSSQSSSISETLSSLQFASRAMAVPSRPIYTSQCHYTPEQPCAYLNGKKDINHLNRQQILPPVGSDRRSQTCLLPVLLSSVSPSEPRLSSGHCADGLELRTSLPQLEKPGQTEPPGRYSRGSRSGDEKNRADGRMTRSLPHSLSGAPSVLLDAAGGRERTGKGLEFSSAQRRSVERLSTSTPSAVVECPNCSHERKIREEYDKIIVQARNDKDSLSQKVAELENELRMRATQERKQGVSWEKKRGNEESTNSTSADPGILQTAEVCWQTEAEGLRAELSKCRERERLLTHTLHSERERLTQDAQDLLTQLNSTRENNSQLMSTFNKQRESLMAELQRSRDELERFRESVSLTLSQLKTEKAELVSHLEDIKSSYEKVCLENTGLRQKLKSFLREINSAPFTKSSSPDPNTLHTVTANTEMIVVSHHVSQKCPAGVTQGSKCCFSQCEVFQHPVEEFTEKSETTNNCEQPLYKPQNIYKQLRREHSLLLDVMLVLYRREWFLQDAIPYVRRTLRKCGLRPEDID